MADLVSKRYAIKQFHSTPFLAPSIMLTYLPPLRFLLVLCVCISFSCYTSPGQADEPEQPLIELLASDASKADKAITCKKLAVWGSETAVPQLAKLLPDPELTSWARIALEAIPGDAADTALIDALETTDGRTLVGVINSIAVRRSSDAVDGLTKKLSGDDLDVAESAAVALGKIGGEGVTETLLAAMKDSPEQTKSAAAEGLILIAERLLADGDAAQAIGIYDAVRQAEVPKTRVVEATRGVILASGVDGVPMLVGLLKSDDRVMFLLGLTVARELEGNAATEALVDSLDQFDAYRKGMLILALADRGDESVLPVMMEVSISGEPGVRVAAIHALQNTGDVSCVNVLLASAKDADADVSMAAKTALAALAGEAVDAAILERVEDSDQGIRQAVIEMIGKRRIAAVPALRKAIDDPNTQTRTAALTALGEVAAFEDVSLLIARVNDSAKANDKKPALEALRAACIRMPDREACAKKLTTAMADVSPGTKVEMLEILASMGGTTALKTLADAAGGSNPALQDAASRLLGGWMTVDAGPVLIQLAKRSDNPYRVRALRGHLRIVRQFLMPDEQRIAMAREAFEASERDAERALVLDAVQRYPSIPMLQLAVEISKIPTLKEEAAVAALTVAQKVGNSEEVAGLLKQLDYKLAEIEIIKATYGAGDKQKDVTEILKKAAIGMPLISLPSSSYNAAFGGDPAPSTPKVLKVIYKIDGKEGQVELRENEVIMLPQPAP